MHRTARQMNRRLMFNQPPVQPDPSAGNAGGGAGGKTFTQDEVNSLAAAEKAQGKRAGVKDLATQLGFEKPEELQAYIEAKRKADEEALTETQRKDAEIAAREAAAAKRERDAEAAVQRATKVTVLAASGSTGANLEDAIRLLDVPADADEAAVKAAVDALQARRPELFTAPPTNQQRPPAPNGTPGKTPPAPGSGTGVPGSRGAAAAERRYGAPANAAS